MIAEVDARAEETLRSVRMILRLEAASPFTQNTHYFADKRDTHLSRYKDARSGRSAPERVTPAALPPSAANTSTPVPSLSFPPSKSPNLLYSPRNQFSRQSPFCFILPRSSSPSHGVLHAFIDLSLLFWGPESISFAAASSDPHAPFRGKVFRNASERRSASFCLRPVSSIRAKSDLSPATASDTLYALPTFRVRF